MLVYFHKNPILKATFLALLCVLLVPSIQTYTVYTVDDDVKTWLTDYDTEALNYTHEDFVANFEYETDLNSDEKQKKSMNTAFALSEFRKKKAQEAQKFNVTEITDETSKRALEIIKDVGISISSDKATLHEISTLTARMLKVYSTACMDIDVDCKKLQPDGLAKIIASSRDYEELKNVWKGWRDVSGKKMRTDFAKWVKLSNQAIQDGPYNDLAESWISGYGPGFVKEVERLLNEIEPFYKLFHAYVRQKLSDHYGKKYFTDNLIPAHLLGNMWAQDWANIGELVLPYESQLNVTGEMRSKGYNVHKMFHKADEFFTSIGLKPMTETFWNESVFTKIDDKEMVCHASAWDFMKKGDFRIKMCTEITMEDFVTIHHEMGHIQYYQQYEPQPVYFRNGANPGFHEAVGDTLALSVSTPQHLKKLGLAQNMPETKDAEINYLMTMAMDKLVFYPFAYIMDKFRWNVFNGEISEKEYTAKWWEYKCKYQGMKPPVERTEDDFDPGAKMHMAGAVPYIRYFVSYVIQFQFHEALCKKAGHKGPLHTCDIYQNTDAGKALADMLKLGSSVPWPEALEKVTGSKKMDATSMLKYFEPLKKWLEEHTDKNSIGWDCGSENGNGASTSSSLSSLFIFCILYVSFFINF